MYTRVVTEGTVDLHVSCHHAHRHTTCHPLRVTMTTYLVLSPSLSAVYIEASAPPDRDLGVGLGRVSLLYGECGGETGFILVLARTPHSRPGRARLILLTLRFLTGDVTASSPPPPSPGARTMSESDRLLVGMVTWDSATVTMGVLSLAYSIPVLVCVCVL